MGGYLPHGEINLSLVKFKQRSKAVQSERAIRRQGLPHLACNLWLAICFETTRGMMKSSAKQNCEYRTPHDSLGITLHSALARLIPVSPCFSFERLSSGVKQGTSKAPMCSICYKEAKQGKSAIIKTTSSRESSLIWKSTFHNIYLSLTTHIHKLDKLEVCPLRTFIRCPVHLIQNIIITLKHWRLLQPLRKA